MAAPLATCTKEQCAVQFLWSEGEIGAEIHQRLYAHYGGIALQQQTMYASIYVF
jgi:hypothetical protein